MHWCKLNWYEWVGIAYLFFTVLPFVIDNTLKVFYKKNQIDTHKRKHAIDNSRAKSFFSYIILLWINSTIAGTCIFFGCWLQNQGKGHLVFWSLTSINDYATILFQVIFILLVFDTQFFWVHRFIHAHPTLYKIIHKEHHSECFPNTWNTLYQHPVDYFLTTASSMGWIVVQPLPIHENSYFIALLIGNYVNIVGHGGYEVTRSILGIITLNGWACYIDPQRRWLAKLLNTVTHHDLHHQKFRCNYSLYFTLWDQIAGTMAPDTDDVYHCSTAHYLHLGKR